MNITGAKGLAIIQQKLKKFLNDATPLDVTMEAADGSTLDLSSYPTGIAVPPGDFFVTSFSDSSLLLTNKTTGIVYDLGAALGSFYYGGPITVGTDASHNLYLRDGNGAIKKIDVSNPASPVATTYSATGDIGTRWFCVDASGNLAYEGSDSGSNGVLRYRKAGGGFETLPGSPNYSHTTCWIGPDAKIYYYGSSAKVKMLQNNAGTFSASDYGTTTLNVGCGFKGIYTISNKGSMIAPGGCTNVYDLYNAGGNPRNIAWTDLGLDDLKMGGASDNYYYLFGTNASSTKVLLRVNPADDSTEVVLNGGYDFYAMVVAPDDTITFNALRLSDGAIVMGSIAADKTLTISAETLTNQVTQLVRLN